MYSACNSLFKCASFSKENIALFIDLDLNPKPISTWTPTHTRLPLLRRTWKLTWYVLFFLLRVVFLFDWALIYFILESLFTLLPSLLMFPTLFMLSTSLRISLRKPFCTAFLLNKQPFHRFITSNSRG